MSATSFNSSDTWISIFYCNTGHRMSRATIKVMEDFCSLESCISNSRNCDKEVKVQDGIFPKTKRQTDFMQVNLVSRHQKPITCVEFVASLSL